MGLISAAQGKEMMQRDDTHAYIDRVASLILMAVTIEHNISSSIIQQILHGQPHALVLLVMRNVCTRQNQSTKGHM